MNTRVVRGLFFGAVGVAVVGTAMQGADGFGFAPVLTTLGLVLAVAFAGMLLRTHLRNGAGWAKTGVEGVPPANEIRCVLLEGVPLADHSTRRLLQAIHRARRARTTDTVVKSVAFQIVDRWGGSWELEAFRDIRGERGFVVNRVAYTGRQAAIVAECVGV